MDRSAGVSPAQDRTAGGSPAPDDSHRDAEDAEMISTMKAIGYATGDLFGGDDGDWYAWAGWLSRAQIVSILLNRGDVDFGIFRGEHGGAIRAACRDGLAIQHVWMRLGAREHPDYGGPWYIECAKDHPKAFRATVFTTRPHKRGVHRVIE